MIGLCHLMAGDDSRMTGGCGPEGSIHRCVRTHSHLYSYIYGLVALLDNIQSSFSSITISTDTGDLAHLAKTNTMCVARYFVLKKH